MSEKIDLTKDLKALYFPSAKAPVLVEVPPMRYLMLDGSGPPGTPFYQAIVSALYSLSYTLKFALKKQQGIDYGVLPLEGQWWVPEGQEYRMDVRDNWQWTMMIRQPEWVTPELIEAARAQVIKKGGDAAAASRAAKARFEVLDEGLAAQILHIGPYDAEPPVIQRLHAFVSEQGYRLRGKHHEIYMGDPNRTAPEKLKTVLRHPVMR
jgi:hypothetical protein